MLSSSKGRPQQQTQEEVLYQDYTSTLLDGTPGITENAARLLYAMEVEKNNASGPGMQQKSAERTDKGKGIAIGANTSDGNQHSNTNGSVGAIFERTQVTHESGTGMLRVASSRRINPLFAAASTAAVDYRALAGETPTEPDYATTLDTLGTTATPTPTDYQNLGSGRNSLNSAASDVVYQQTDSLLLGASSSNRLSNPMIGSVHYASVNSSKNSTATPAYAMINSSKNSTAEPTHGSLESPASDAVTGALASARNYSSIGSHNHTAAPADYASISSKRRTRPVVTAVEYADGNDLAGWAKEAQAAGSDMYTLESEKGISAALYQQLPTDSTSGGEAAPPTPHFLGESPTSLSGTDPTQRLGGRGCVDPTQRLGVRKSVDPTQRLGGRGGVEDRLPAYDAFRRSTGGIVGDAGHGYSSVSGYMPGSVSDEVNSPDNSYAHAKLRDPRWDYNGDSTTMYKRHGDVVSRDGNNNGAGGAADVQWNTNSTLTLSPGAGPEPAQSLYQGPKSIRREMAAQTKEDVV